MICRVMGLNHLGWLCGHKHQISKSIFQCLYLMICNGSGDFV